MVELPIEAVVAIAGVIFVWLLYMWVKINLKVERGYIDVLAHYKKELEEERIKGGVYKNATGQEPIKMGTQSKEDGTAKGASHYQQAEVELIEIIQMYFTREMFLGFLIGNVIKYALRFRFKGQEGKDIAKMKQYAAWADIVSKGGEIKPRE